MTPRRGEAAGTAVKAPRRHAPDGIPRMLTVPEVAAMLALSIDAVYRLCAEGEANGGLAAFRFHCRKPNATRGAIRIRIDAVERYLDRSLIR